MTAADEARWADFMRRAIDGDREAYRALMEELAPVVRAHVVARFGPVDFLEDCVQECLLAIHRARATWNPERPLRPWLFTLVRHKTIDQLRRQGTQRRVLADSDGVARARSPAFDPSADLDGARILDGLSPPHREALLLTRLAGYSVSEAAREVGVSESAMRSRLHRALRAARRHLRHERFEEGTS